MMDWVEVMNDDLGIGEEPQPSGILQPLGPYLRALGIREDLGKPTEWKKVQDYWIASEAEAAAVQLQIQGWEVKKKNEIIGLSLWKRRPVWYIWKER